MYALLSMPYSMPYSVYHAQHALFIIPYSVCLTQFQHLNSETVIAQNKAASKHT